MPSLDGLDEIFKWAQSALDRDGGAATAVELLTAYVAERPQHHFAVFLLGDALRELGRFEEAEEMLLRALSCAPPTSRASIMARLGMLKNKHGVLAEAEEWFLRATSDETGKGKGWIWIMRGANLAILGHCDAAASCHERATQLEGGDRDEAFLNLGYVRRAQRRYAEAADAFRKAIDLSPGYTEAIAALDGLGDVIAAMNCVAALKGG